MNTSEKKPFPRWAAMTGLFCSSCSLAILIGSLKYAPAQSSQGSLIGTGADVETTPAVIINQSGAERDPEIYFSDAMIEMIVCFVALITIMELAESAEEGQADF